MVIGFSQNLYLHILKLAVDKVSVMNYYIQNISELLVLKRRNFYEREKIRF